MAGLGAEVLVAGGLATLVFGTIGVLASQGLGRLAGCAVLVSSGTLLAVVGMASSAGGSAMVAGALFYLVASTLAIAALFLMVELIEREQGALAGILTVTAEAYGLGDDEVFGEDEIRDTTGPGVAGATTVLGSVETDGHISDVALAFTGLVILSGLAALIALVREGIRTFWASDEGELPAVPLIELAPVLVLLALTAAMTVKAGPVMRYMEATASMLNHPHVYVEGVLGTEPVPHAPAPPAEGTTP